MIFAEAMEDQFLKGTFRRATAVYNIDGWYIQGDFGGTQIPLTSVTDPADLTGAKAASEAYLNSHGYFQITYWADWDPQTSKSAWFLPS